MGSERRSERYEIVAKFDGYCTKCRGKVLAGSGVAYNANSKLLEHLVCPPVAPIARQAFHGVPVTPARWKELCQQMQENVMGVSGLRMVLDEDRKAYEAEGALGMIRSVLGRTRCTGPEAVEIVREWIDSLRKPVDEERFQRVNQSCRREQPVAIGDGSPTTDDEAPVDWDAEA